MSSRVGNRLLIAGLTVAFGVLSMAYAQQTPAPTPEATAGTEVHQSSGAWNTEGRMPKPVQQWTLNVMRTPDNAIRGRISVSGSPIISEANVEGRISGFDISGTLSDDKGRQLASFRGTVSSTTASGTYKDYTGEEGTWSGKLP